MKRVIITVSEYSLNRLHMVADDLREEGVTIIHIFEYGVIVGMAEQETIERIRRNKEIVSLSEDKDVGIAPPDSGIQTLNDEEPFSSSD